MSLNEAFLDELRSRTLLSALIGRTVKLQRAGREYRACCPFHQEKSPSFYVNDDKGFYHCFGCSAHGDAIRFLTETQGLGFVDAVKELAQAAGMEMPAPDPRQAVRQQQQATLTDVMKLAADWFGAQLHGLGGAEARAYLDRRRISSAIQQRFHMGFAPDMRGALKTALGTVGEATLIEAGLLIDVEGKVPYDRFRGRVMIPIRDPRGRVIAFGGRVLDSGEPKYLNSPDTPLFDKGRTLFNLDLAAPAARKADRLFVVEGYMDVIALAQAGVDEVVAPLGTALTEHQLDRLWRIVDTPTLCFDGDKAGRAAAQRAAKRALPVLQIGKSLRFVTLPAGEDPDDVVGRGGKAAWETAIASTEPLVSLLYRTEREGRDANSPDDRAKLRGTLDGLAESCTDRLVSSEYRRSFTEKFFEEFGWGARNRNAVRESVIRTGPHGAAGLMKLYIRSALYGLTRYPRVIATHFDVIDKIRIDLDDLKRWRDEILDAVIRVPHLDDDGIAAILATSKDLPEKEAFDLRQDLRFSFLASEDEAVRDIPRLRALIEVMSQEADLDEEMLLLNRQAIEDTGLGRYEAIEVARQKVRERKLALRRYAFDVGSEDIESDGTALRLVGGN